MNPMQSLMLPGVPPIHPSFKRHRFDSDPYRFSLNLSLSNQAPVPCGASLPSPPMSGSPPLEVPPEPSQQAGRRRKRSDTPTTQESSPVVPSTSVSAEGRLERHDVLPAIPGSSIPPPTWRMPTSTSPSYGFGSSSTMVMGPAPNPFHPPYPRTPMAAPRSTRKSKVHVPSACVNCKKKHLRCDNTRPCHRCTQSGKEVGKLAHSGQIIELTTSLQDTCVDVQHKKRGRPPLKADDGGSRELTGLEVNRATQSIPQALLTEHSRTEQQSRPQGPQTHPIAPREAAHPPFPRRADTRGPHLPLAPSPYGLYAAPSINPSYATASGTTYGPVSQRPISRDSSLASSHPTSPYYLTQSSGTTPEGPIPGMQGVIGQGQGASAQARDYHSPGMGAYNMALFPRTSALHETSPTAYSQPAFPAPGLRLPPIQQAPPGSYSMPAIAQQQQRQAQQLQERESRSGGRVSDSGERPPEPKKPRMSLGNIVNPRND